MRSEVPKALQPLAGWPLVAHATAAAAKAAQTTPLVVIGPDQNAVADALGDLAMTVVQAQPRGTGDALRSVPAELRSMGTVLVVSGDVPLLRAATLEALLERHQQQGSACTLLSVVPDDPAGLGRIVRDETGAVRAVVEERDLPASEPVPAECNAGVYVFAGERLWPALEQLRDDNAQGELYLTDAVALLAPAAALRLRDPEEALGVNDRRQLAAAEATLRRRVLEDLMLSGVTVMDPATTYVDVGVSIGADSVLHPMTVLRGVTRLGRGCEVGPMAQLRNVSAGDAVRIGSSTLEESRLGDRVVIGQYCRLRPGTVLGEDVYVGTHVELKNSSVGAGSYLSHFCAVLDSNVGSQVNVGAGTITCNFDGAAKHTTFIGDGVFVGSDSILVAPLVIGAGAYVAAGSVVTHDVPRGALAVARADQTTVEGWVERRRARLATAGAAVEST